MAAGAADYSKRIVLNTHYSSNSGYCSENSTHPIRGVRNWGDGVGGVSKF